MLPCTDCRSLILDHLYGLLDPAEAASVEAHLAACPACADARAEAARMQGLIATAARGAFPAVRFEAPAAKPGKAAPPVAQPARQPLLTPAAEARGSHPAGGKWSARVAVWLPWAVAAAVLVAIPGTVVPVMGVLTSARAAVRDAEAARAKVATAGEELAKVEQTVVRKRNDTALALAAAQQGPELILGQWMEDEKAAARRQTASRVSVLKPAAVQPGAPNELLLVIHNRDRAPVGRVVAEVRDQTDAVIHSQPIEYDRQHDHTVRLPARIWTGLTPKSELFLSVASVDEKSQKRTELQDRVRLLGPVFATLLTTDKPTYRPGETVLFRSLTLDRTTFTPPQREQLFRYELRDPRGQVIPGGVVSGGTELARVAGEAVEPVRGPDGKPLRGVGAGAIAVPPGAADGDYTLVLTELPHPAGHPPAVPFPVTRTVKVRSAPAEMYHKKLDYVGAASYVAGDKVEATAELKLRDLPVEGAEIHAVATADNRVLDVFAAQPKTDASGKARLRFTLPPELPMGDVRLQVTFRTRSGEEVVAERVPVVGRNVVVEFFPEGGDLVAGVPCRVYFRATTPGGLPVDVAGVVTDGRRVLAEVKTVTDDAAPGVNRGLGSFEYTPELGTPVWLKLSSPAAAYAPLLPPNGRHLAVAPVAAAGGAAVAAARTGFILPRAQDRGVVMRVHNPVTAPGEPIRVHLQSVAQTRNLVVGAYTRGRLSDTQKVTAAAGQVVEVRLMAGADPRGGVVRVTAFEEPAEVAGQPAPDLKPVAERLVFRKPGELLNLDLAVSGPPADAAGFAPGATVNLGVTATTDKEKRTPAAAILYAAVVNSAVAANPRDRLLTTHFLVAGEVDTPDAMEYADFLLGDHPRAAETLDHVLATQGWRRFAEQTPRGYAKRQVVPSAGHANLMVSNGQYAVWAEQPSATEHRRLFETYWPRYEAALKKLEAVRAAVEAAQADQSDESRVREAAAKVQAAREEEEARASRAEEAAAPVARLRGAGWYAVAGFGLLAVLLGAASLTRSTGRLPLGIGTAGSVGLAAFLVFALAVADRTHAAVAAAEAAAAPQTAQKHEEAPLPRELARGGRSGADNLTLAAPDAQQTDGVPARGGFADGKNRKPGAGFVPPPKAPVPPQPEPNLAFGGAGGIGGAGPPGGPGPERASPREPGAGMVPPRWPFPPPGLPKLGRAEPAAPPGGGVPAPPPSDKNDFPHRFALDGGWQPGRKPVPDEGLGEEKLLALFADQKKNASPKPGVGVPALGGGVAGFTPAGSVASTGARPNADRTAKQESQTYFQEVESVRRWHAERAKSVQLQVEQGLGTRFLQMKDRPESGVARPRLSESTPEAVALDRIQSAVRRATPLVVREYAAPRPGSAGEAGGLAESDTVLWQPVIVLPSDGKTTLSFDVGHARGGYQVIVAGHTLDGRIGAVRGFVPVAHPEPNATPSPVPTVPPAAPGGPDKR